jgi:hypothetical protein
MQRYLMCTPKSAVLADRETAFFAYDRVQFGSDCSRRIRRSAAKLCRPRMLGALADAIRMRSRTGQLAAIDNQIFLPDRTPLEPAFEDFPGSY